MERKKVAVGGRLKLKGVAISKHKKKSIRPVVSKHKVLEAEHEQPEEELSAVEAGSGRIVTSGSTVQGFETKFQSEIAVGDTIILFHPSLLKEEERIVVGILSQRSLTIHEKLSGDVASTTPYRIRKDSVLLQRKAAAGILNTSSTCGGGGGGEASSSFSASDPQVLQDEISRQLQKTLKKAKPTFTYREKTGMWGYRVVTEAVEQKNVTAEDLLDKRVKKMGRDKFCW